MSSHFTDRAKLFFLNSVDNFLLPVQLVSQIFVTDQIDRPFTYSSCSPMVVLRAAAANIRELLALSSDDVLLYKYKNKPRLFQNDHYLAEA